MLQLPYRQLEETIQNSFWKWMAKRFRLLNNWITLLLFHSVGELRTAAFLLIYDQMSQKAQVLQKSELECLFVCFGEMP